MLGPASSSGQPQPTAATRPNGPGGCARPQPWLNPETGEIILGRCKQRTRDLCELCAGIYERDVKNIARSGLAQHADAGEPTLIVTLTGGQFWKPDAPKESKRVHRFYPKYWQNRARPKISRKYRNSLYRRAICGYCTEQARQSAKKRGQPVSSVRPVLHRPNDPLAGIPIDPDAFDYQAAVAWAWNLGFLWHRTTTYLDRANGKVQHLRAIEMQRRGVPHIHALIAGDITADQIRDAIDAVNASVPAGEGWGPQIDIQQLGHGAGPTGRGIASAAVYVAKYVTKDSAAGLLYAGYQHPDAAEHFRRFERAARQHVAEHAEIQPYKPCPQPGCPGRLAPNGPHSNRLHCTMRQDPTAPCTKQYLDRTLRHATQLGIRSLTLTKSHNWAHECRQSRVNPGTYKPVINKDGTQVRLTLGCIARQRRRWFLKMNPDADRSPLTWIPRSSRRLEPIRPPP